MKYVLDNKNSRIYEVVEVHHDNKECFTRYELQLVCGIDYVPYSDLQSWVPAKRFIDSVQYEHITYFPLYDGKLDVYLASLDMKVIDTLPVIHG